jgi:ubiquinone biosynthesis protein
MSEQVGARAFANRLKSAIPQWGEKLPELPSLIHDVFSRARAGTLQVEMSPVELKRITHEIRRANRRSVTAIAGGSLVVSAALIAGLDGYTPAMWGHLPALSWLLGAFGLGAWVVLLVDG